MAEMQNVVALPYIPSAYCRMLLFTVHDIIISDAFYGYYDILGMLLQAHVISIKRLPWLFTILLLAIAINIITRLSWLSHNTNNSGFMPLLPLLVVQPLDSLSWLLHINHGFMPTAAAFHCAC